MHSATSTVVYCNIKCLLTHDWHTLHPGENHCAAKVCDRWRVRVPEAFACAVSGSVSGPVSAPSCPVLGSRPWTSSFTVYTNNSIYKEITPKERRMREVLQICDYDLLMSCTCLAHLYTTSSNCLLGVGWACNGIKKTPTALFSGTLEKRWQGCFWAQS